MEFDLFGQDVALRQFVQDLSLFTIHSRLFDILQAQELTGEEILHLHKLSGPLERITRSLYIPCFSAAYKPLELEVLYDNVLFLKTKETGMAYQKNWLEIHQPITFEMRFDGEVVLFMMNSRVIMDRIARDRLLQNRQTQS